MRRKKDAAAQALVRKRWKKSTAEERSEAARHAVNARWARYRAAKAEQEPRAS